MQGKRIIRNLKLNNFLSFGGNSQEVELQSLNVLIGPNASGKSNLIEVFRILKATQDDIKAPIREGGGILEYLYKGSTAINFNITLEVDWKPLAGYPLLYQIALGRYGPQLFVYNEEIKGNFRDGSENAPPFFYRSHTAQKKGAIYARRINAISEFHDEFEIAYVENQIKVNDDQSILSQIKDPENYHALSHLQDVFSRIYFYNGWNLGRYGALRYPQKADLPSDFLLEDGSNLGLILINKPSNLRQQITERLKAVLPTVEEIFPKVEGGTVPLYIREKGFSTPTPAARLSEGTLRYLCLLTLLLDPTPPPIICLEEPEAGLHPHVVSQIAELLIDASQRTQLIVTTHSDALISGLTDCPEAIIICERDEEGTKLRRLEAEQIKPWLDRYAIGDLWRMGEIGGVR